MKPFENHLIELMPRKERTRFLTLCEPFKMVLSEVLSQSGKPTRHVYFPTQGFISLVAEIDGKPGLEVGIIGPEGMLGSQLALGVAAAPLKALVQGAGTAWCMTAKAFKAELASNAALRGVLNRYVYVIMAQYAESAVCLRFHSIGERLARWLLMSHDRSRTDSFEVTQEFLAFMLGVRRVGVTGAAGVLQSQGLIQYSRGKLTVVDRKGLESAACSCYATDQKTYAGLL